MTKQTLRPFHTQIRFKKAPAKTQAKVYFVGNSDKKKVAGLLKKWATPWQQKLMLDGRKDVMHFSHKEGPVWILAAPGLPGLTSHEGRLEDSEYAWARDHVGALLAQWRAYKVKTVSFEFHETTSEQERGALVGLGLAAYSFKNSLEDKEVTEPLVFVTKSKGEVDKTLAANAAALAHAVNWARHLVNMPPNWLNPKTYAELVVGLFKNNKNVKVEVWDHKRLIKEGMGLHTGVGQGAANPPCLVHIRYRPGKKTSAQPIALVGKGITFDSGGLDIKPSSGMRLMKKDMGGSAAVVGTMLWAEGTDYQRPLDAYIALAENAVDAESMRPSDVLIARNGMKVEIHNTDAEGRLVLADALDVAVTAKGADEPEMVINLATLTGAIKVALGAEIAGLFSNHDDLSQKLEKSGQAVGELSWRMPLYSRYANGMSTAFGDMVNAVDGFGGAITAALFLEKFVKQKPWAHLDIYAWNDKPTGALSFAGGSGQGVQTLSQFLKDVEGI